MTSSRRRAFLMFGLVAVLALSGSTQAVVYAAGSDSVTASETTHRVQSSISAHYNSRKRVISGFVSHNAPNLSPDEDGCLDDRKVSLLKISKVGGQLRERAVDSQRTDLDGFYGWKFNSQNAARGSWSVKVEKRVFSDRYGDLVECSGAHAPNTIKI